MNKFLIAAVLAIASGSAVAKGNKPCSTYSGCRLCMKRGGDNCGWKVNYLDGSQSCVENAECDSVDNATTFCTKANEVEGYPGEGKNPKGDYEDRKATCRALNELRKKGPPEPPTCGDFFGDCGGCLVQGCFYDTFTGNCVDSEGTCGFYDDSVCYHLPPGYPPSKAESLCSALDKPQPPTDDQSDSFICTNLNGACSVCVDRGCVYDYLNDACFDAGTTCDGCLELDVETPNYPEILTDYCLNGPTIEIGTPGDDGYDRPDGYDGPLTLYDEDREAPPPKPDLPTDDEDREAPPPKPDLVTDDQSDSFICTNLDGACSVCVDRGCVYDYENDACFDAGTTCDGCLELSTNTPNFGEIVTDYCRNGPTIIIVDDGYDRPDGYDGREAPPPKPDLVTDDQSFTCEELSTVCEICLDRGCKYDYDSGDCFDADDDACPGCYVADVSNGYTTEVFNEIAGFCQTGRIPKPDLYTDPQDFACEDLAGACDICLDRGCAYDGETCYDECPAGAECVTASDTETSFATCADLIGVRR